ncbi:polysaccharide deacetylase family protein [Azospirillum halopraeferens]|uniref:polysaccharide deacetylase family protein n=1 Tax=Azospirillum halopraeferens TaxID=34010 RepID=UPI0004146D37|nr:polysaccharide deacetylase family protein [Azospirillum halopraeferens]
MPFRSTALLLLASAWAVLAAPVAPRAADPDAAVVFAYNRFGEDPTPASSIRLDQFEAHLDELTSDDYTVLPLPAIVEALRAGRPLPDRAVAITIDDASRSFLTEAWPRLRQAGLPFTLFVATDPVDRRAATHMTWDELRRLAGQPGVTIGALGATAMPLVDRPADQVRAELRRMAGRLRAELGVRPTLFAYPQGEYSTAVRALVAEELEVAAAFGLQSGVVYGGADRQALPRFVMTEAFGSVERFRLAANALPLPVMDMTPEDPVLTVNPPLPGFTVAADVGDLSQLACFASGQGRATLERVADDRIEVRVAEPFAPGRARLNCTLPTADGRWRWFGMQFVVPEPPDPDPEADPETGQPANP